MNETITTEMKQPEKKLSDLARVEGQIIGTRKASLELMGFADIVFDTVTHGAERPKPETAAEKAAIPEGNRYDSSLNNLEIIQGALGNIRKSLNGIQELTQREM